MGKLLEISKCGECKHYIVRGYDFHCIDVKDSVGNNIHLSFGEYIGYCDRSHRIILDNDPADFPLWCKLLEVRD